MGDILKFIGVILGGIVLVVIGVITVFFPDAAGSAGVLAIVAAAIRLVELFAPSVAELIRRIWSGE